MDALCESRYYIPWLTSISISSIALSLRYQCLLRCFIHESAALRNVIFSIPEIYFSAVLSLSLSLSFVLSLSVSHAHIFEDSSIISRELLAKVAAYTLANTRIHSRARARIRSPEQYALLWL